MNNIKIIIILSLFFTFVNAEKLEHVSLQLKWKYQFQFAGFIVAKEKGFYRDAGLKVTMKEHDDSINIIEDVVSGKSDFGVGDSSLIYASLKGKPVSAMMAIFQDSPLILMGLKSNKIKTLEDLNYKNIALYGGVDGFAVKIMLKAKNIKYTVKPPIYTLDKLASGEVDMMSAYISNEPYIAKTKNIDIIIFHPKDYGFDSYGDILFTSKKMLKNYPHTVHKMNEATYRGWEYAFNHIDEVVNLIYKKYNTLNKTKEALQYEAITLKELSGYGEGFGELNIEKIKSIAQIYNLINKEFYKLDVLDDFIYNSLTCNLALNEDEEEYIKKKKTINICVKGLQEPIFIKERRKYSGVSVDYLKIISEQTHLKLNYVYYTTIKDYLGGVRSGKCDLVSLIVAEPNTYTFLTPTIPYVSDEIVLATKIDEPYVYNLNSLTDEKIMIEKGTKNFIKYIKYIYPNLNIIEVAEIDLQRVVDGEFYGLINSAYFLKYNVSNKYSNKIKIMTTIGDTKLSGSFGISNREPHLLSIFNKSIKEIPQSMKQKIKNSYKTVNIEKQIDYVFVWKIIGVFLLIIIVILIAYLKQGRLRKRVEEEKNKFQNIFDKASDGISILTNGVFTDCNDAFVKTLGYENRKQLLKLKPADLSPKYQPDGEESITKALLMMQYAKEKGVNRFEWIHLKANGDEFWVDVALTNISITKREELIHVVLRDIQHTKELEVKLKELNINLENKIDNEIEKNRQQKIVLMEQSRLAQMGEMISMIAHQWRQPLNSLSLITQAIALKYKMNKLDDKVIDKFDTNSKNLIAQMSNTIDDFRNFFKPEKEKTFFDVTASIVDTLNILGPMLEREQIKIDVYMPETITIEGYQSELGQVLINLLNNSKDALVEHNIDTQRIIKICTKSDEDKKYVIVEDNAGGIKENVIDKIFDPYFSTKAEQHGTGIGLYMSKMIIEGHMDGNLKVENIDDGVRFTIEFKTT